MNEQVQDGKTKNYEYETKEQVSNYFDISDKGQSLLKDLLNKMHDVFRVAKSRATRGELPGVFFMHHVEDDKPMVGLFQPDQCMIGLPEYLSDEDRKDIVFTAIREVVAELHCYAVVHITEAWMLGKDDLSPAEQEFIADHGVSQHPEAVEKVLMHAYLSYRGQTVAIQKTIDIVPRNSGRVLVNESKWEILRDMEDRMVFEAHLLDPLI